VRLFELPRSQGPSDGAVVHKKERCPEPNPWIHSPCYGPGPFYFGTGRIESPPVPRALKTLCLAALALAVLLCAAGPARADTDPRGPPLALEADRLTYRQGDDVVEAAGGVEVRYQGYRLTADRLTYDRAAGQITATGDVVLATPTGDVHRAQAFTLSGDMRDGTATALTSLMADDSHFRAARGQRAGGTRTTMHDAAYTPCPIACADGSPKTPDWEIEAERVVHDEAAQTVTYRNARFRFFGVPLLYTPYFAHPDGSVKYGV